LFIGSATQGTKTPGSLHLKPIIVKIWFETFTRLTLVPLQSPISNSRFSKNKTTKDRPRFSYCFIFKLCFNFLLSIVRFPPPFGFLFSPLCSSSISKPIHTPINFIVKLTHMPFNPRPTSTNTNNTCPLSWDPPTNLSCDSAKHITDIRKRGRNSTIEG
jgi:hypothetical protein